MSSNTFITGRAVAILVAASLVYANLAAAGVGRVFPPERSVVKDAATGVDLILLTNGRQSDSRIYQTHPQWTADGQWIVFRSSGRSPGSQAYAVHEASGTIVQLTDGAGNNTSSLCLARRSMKLYFLRNASAQARGLPAAEGPAPATQPDPLQDEHQLVELDLERLLEDAQAQAMRPARDYERVCFTFAPGSRPGGGAALDADERRFYVSLIGGDVGQHLDPGEQVWVKPPGMRMGTGPGGIRAIDTEAGTITRVLDTPFQVGHVQTNPWVPGEIVYCHETGGDAPQRIWTVQADGSGNRPVYVEEPTDWVTHETFVSRDEVMFNLIGHQKRLRARPTGICVVNLRTNAVQLLGQIDEREVDGLDDLPRENAAGPDAYGGFWHCNGSADGRWAVGDTFGGDIWLIDRRDGRRILLSRDHKMKPDHAHPAFSSDGQRILIQSGRFTDGARLQLMVIPIPDAQR